MTEQAVQVQVILGIVLAMAGAIVAALIAIAGGITIFVTNTWKGRIAVLEEQAIALKQRLDDDNKYWKEKVGGLEDQIIVLDTTIGKMGTTIRDLQANQKPPPVALTPAVEAVVAAVTDTPAPKSEELP